jgi:predicted RNA-binding protein (TIGR00451 family)
LKSNLLSKSKTIETIEKIHTQWNIDIPKTKALMIHEIDDNTSLITGDDFSAIKIDEIYIPFLAETILLERFPKVIVDVGAIKFVCNGANVMRPGIKNFTKFNNGQIVCVADETHNKFLAVGRSLISSDELSNITKGEVVKNLHYISDRLWEAAKEIKK